MELQSSNVVIDPVHLLLMISIQPKRDHNWNFCCDATRHFCCLALIHLSKMVLAPKMTFFLARANFNSNTSVPPQNSEAILKCTVHCVNLPIVYRSSRYQAMLFNAFTVKLVKCKHIIPCCYKHIIPCCYNHLPKCICIHSWWKLTNPSGCVRGYEEAFKYHSYKLLTCQLFKYSICWIL